MPVVSPLVTNSPLAAVRTARLASALPTNSTPGCNSFRSLISSTLNCYRSCDQIQRRFLHKLLFCSMRAEPSWTLPAPLSALPEEISGSQSPALSSFLPRLPVLTLASRVSYSSAHPASFLSSRRHRGLICRASGRSLALRQAGAVRSRS